MWVTLYTDASWHPGRREGGWAVWAKSEVGRIVRSGACPPYAKSATHAEMAAVFAGIYLVLRTWGAKVEGIQVRSDNQQAMEAVGVRAPLSRDPVLRRLQEKVRELVQGRVHIRPRWVKGHRNPQGDVTAWLNAHCDREARRARKGLSPERSSRTHQPEARAPSASPTAIASAPRHRKRKKKRRRRAQPTS